MSAVSTYLAQWTMQESSEQDTLEKRQRLAQGERLMVRTVLKSKEPFNSYPGGFRELNR